MLVSSPQVPSKAPSKVAILVPISPDGLWPKTPMYAKLLEDIRGPKVDVWVFTLPWGILEESVPTRYPELFPAAYDHEDFAATREAVVRTRAWLLAKAATYLRVIVIGVGETMAHSARLRGSVWSRSAEGLKLPTYVVKVPRKGGVESPLVQKRILGAMKIPLRIAVAKGQGHT